MRALIFHGPGDLRLEEVPDPEPRPGDVLVQVEAALTDGTDLKAYRRGHPVLLGEPPSPFGHEFCGIDVATGRRVVAANSDGNADDLRLLNGAYAELLVVPERIARVNLLPVPDGLAPEVAALVEPLACCLHGVERAGIRGGESVAVLGAGPIGLMLCACLADAGAGPIVVGGRPERREPCRSSAAARAPVKVSTWRSRPSARRTPGSWPFASCAAAGRSSSSAACRPASRCGSTRIGSTTTS